MRSSSSALPRLRRYGAWAKQKPARPASRAAERNRFASGGASGAAVQREGARRKTWRASQPAATAAETATETPPAAERCAPNLGMAWICYPHRAMGADRLLRWLVAAAGVIVGCGVAVWVVLWVSVRSTAAHVPNVAGMESAHAAAVIQNAGLVARVQQGVFDPQVTVGRVAVQRPPAGFELKRGGIVLLYPSLGKAVQKVVDLTGMPLSLADAELESERLTLERSCEVEGQADAVLVIAQEPAPGTLVAPGSAVTLLVNRSPRERRYVMLDLVGSAETDATRVLRNLGFQLATVQPVSYPGVPAGTVLRQDPAAGGPVAQAAVVGLWVSR
jgi:serine/threonine-protein kinase